MDSLYPELEHAHAAARGTEHTRSRKKELCQGIERRKDERKTLHFETFAYHLVGKGFRVGEAHEREFFFMPSRDVFNIIGTSRVIQ